MITYRVDLRNMGASTFVCYKKLALDTHPSAHYNRGVDVFDCVREDAGR